MVDASSFTSTVPVPSVDATGCHIPSFEDIYTALLNDYLSVYGADVDGDFSDQDMEWIGIQAKAFSDYCASFAAAYNAFSPATAQGTGLSSVVKINGIAREVSSFSQADLTIVGVAGTILAGCVASDGTYKWDIPTIVIPPAGQIIATAVCETIGAIAAAAGTITQLATPTRGWQSVTNDSSATPGAPIETDPALRIRQIFSTALPSTTVLAGIIGAVMAVNGVTRLRGYENDTNTSDLNGIPGHAISLVIDGGDAQTIANTIGVKKTPGAGTYGDAVETYVDPYGIPHAIRFFRPAEVPITYALTVKALVGFTALIQANLQQALSDWTNALGIGSGVLLPRAYVPAQLGGGTGSGTYEVVSLQIARDGAAPSAVDVAIAFNEAPLCQPGYITVTVTT